MPSKLEDFASLCGVAIVLLFLGVILPSFFQLYALLAFIVMLVGTLPILGLVKD